MNHTSSFKNKTLAFYYENYEKRNNFAGVRTRVIRVTTTRASNQAMEYWVRKPCLFYLHVIKKGLFFTVTGYFIVKVCFLWDICVYVSPK